MDIQLDKCRLIGCIEVSTMNEQENFSHALYMQMKRELMQSANLRLLETGIISKDLYEAYAILVSKLKED